MPYWKLNYHLVWGTKQRQPVLTGEIARVAKASILAAATDLGLRVHSIAIQPDHVHLAVAIPPRWSVAETMRRLKGGSSHLLRKTFGERWVGWQAEYGAVAFGERSLQRVIQYVANQEAHHRDDLVWWELEKGIDEESSPAHEPVVGT